MINHDGSYGDMNAAEGVSRPKKSLHDLYRKIATRYQTLFMGIERFTISCPPISVYFSELPLQDECIVVCGSSDLVHRPDPDGLVIRKKRNETKMS